MVTLRSENREGLERRLRKAVGMNPKIQLILDAMESAQINLIKEHAYFD